MDSNRRPLASRNLRSVQALATMLAKRGVSPNAISFVGMIFATLGALLLLLAGSWIPIPQMLVRLTVFLAAACVQLRLLCNLLDGLVAVEGGRKGKAGALWNEAPDRYEDAVLLAAAGYASGSLSLGLFAALLAVLTAYARAFGASLGLGQDFRGPMAKPQRMFWLTVGLVGSMFYAPALRFMLVFIAVGTAVTVVRRLGRIYKQLP